jgi:hypothetical protein
MMPMMIGLMFGLFRGGLKSPFADGFSATHFIPQALGFITYTVCMLLPYGTDYKGVWLFQLVSDKTYWRFARGVHAAIWLVFLAVPNVVLFPFLAWYWGLPAAAAFFAYGLASSSMYLAFGLRTVEGVPFGKQNTPGRDTGGRGGAVLFGLFFAAAMGAGFEYLVFRSAITVVIATLIVASLSYLVTRWTLRTFETAIRHHISTSSQMSSMIYTEV